MKRGFTLIEVLVALALFSVIVTIAVGAFTNALRTQRQVALLISTQSNASLALEQMAREMRTGYLFCTTPSSTVGKGNGDTSSFNPNPACQSACQYGPNNNYEWTCSLLVFWNAEGSEVEYSLSGPEGSLERSEVGTNNSATQAITSDNVSIKYLTFTLFGNLEDDGWNPRITISMGVAPSTTDPALQNNVINLQTTVGARDCGTFVGGC